MAQSDSFKLKMSRSKWAIVGLLSVFFLLSDNLIDSPESETILRHLAVKSSSDQEETIPIQCSLHQENRSPEAFEKCANCKSQGNQDEILQRIFDTIGIKNYRCVEFGIGRSTKTVDLTLDDFLLNRNNKVLNDFHLNTHKLVAEGWTPTFFDDKFVNPNINLYKKTLTPDNIAEAFEEAGVPTDVDYVSIDVDSVDAWLMQGLFENGYRPRVISVEFNANFPLDMPLSVQREYVPWKSKCRVYGASASALNLVAEMHGYQVVEVMDKLDIFFVRKDILQKKCTYDSIPSLEYLAEGLVGVPFHNFCYKEDAERLVDFPLAMAGLEKLAKEKAMKQIKELNGRFQDEHGISYCDLK